MYKKKLLNKFKRKGITEIVNNGNNTNFIVLGSFHAWPYRIDLWKDKIEELGVGGQN